MQVVITYCNWKFAGKNNANEGERTREAQSQIRF